ncbi:MAG: cytidylate kinase-like family protein [Lachnospiraceae bacterium]|nr:cytidylate kinase-like family protein [Lachnospiraceae bacterium]
MSDHLVITIGRECGSGGRQIGQEIAKRLGVKCYDQELLTMCSRNSGLCEDIFRTHDEKPVNSFLYSLVMDTYSLGYATPGYMEMPLNQKVFLAQFETIKRLAEQESCVIVGRCADYALAEHPHMISVFIAADEEDKIPWLMDMYGFDEHKARDFMLKADKRRASYYNYYTNKKWGAVSSYDLCLNTSAIGRERCADIIIEFAKKKEEFLKAGRVDSFANYFKDKK